MNNKNKIIILSTIAVLSYVGFFVYQRRLRRQANESVVTLEEALDILNKK